MNKKNRNVLLNFLIAAAASFLLIYFGLKVVSDTPMSMQNGFMLLGFCTLISGVSSLFLLINLKTAYYIFNAGLLVGLFDMYRNFFRNLGGWEDLTGIASLYIWLLIGLCSGLVMQLGQLIYKKYVGKSTR